VRATVLLRGGETVDILPYVGKPGLWAGQPPYRRAYRGRVKPSFDVAPSSEGVGNREHH
jgi:hypothetical protein